MGKSTKGLFRPKDGQTVTCPESFGPEAGYRGIIEGSCDTVHENIHGHPYVWTTVRNPQTGRKTVWPSNRLTA